MTKHNCIIITKAIFEESYTIANLHFAAAPISGNMGSMVQASPRYPPWVITIRTNTLHNYNVRIYGCKWISNYQLLAHPCWDGTQPQRHLLHPPLPPSLHYWQHLCLPESFPTEDGVGTKTRPWRWSRNRIQIHVICQIGMQSFKTDPNPDTTWFCPWPDPFATPVRTDVLIVNKKQI